MISVAVQGFGIVIWDDDGRWRTFSASDSLSALLSARVELALRQLPPNGATADSARAALLSITGAHLFAVDCDHGPGECEEEDARN